MSHIYLDNNATTRMDPRVLEVMLPYFCDDYGNAASRSHSFGWTADDAVKRARQQVADLIGADPKEIIFTSGATESDNLAIKGTVEMLVKKGKHVITCVTEHKAILDSVKYLESKGLAEVTWLPVDNHGFVTASQVEEAVRDDTVLISIMAANNEIGILQPIAEIGAMAHRRGVWFHTDATQAIAKVPFDVNSMGVDMASFSGHKIYGPKGVGALYVRRRKPRVRLSPHMHGGGHERGMRSGTLNVPGIVGLGEACRIAKEDLEQDMAHSIALRDRLGRIADHGHAQRGRVVRLCVHLRQPRTQLRAACHRCRRRPGSQLDSLLRRPVHHRRRRRPRRRSADQDGPTSARHVTSLRNGPGRHRPQRGQLEDALRCPPC